MLNADELVWHKSYEFIHVAHYQKPPTGSTGVEENVHNGHDDVALLSK